MEQQTNPTNGQTIIIQNESPKSNGIGTAGFVLALIAFFIGWIPIIGQIFGFFIWLLGLIFSFIGIFRKPKGLAIAGLVISLFWVIIFFFFVGIVAATTAASAV